MFYKSTSFLAGKFVFEDHLRLEYVLKNIGILDEEMLEILTYVQIIYPDDNRDKEIGIKSALHMAVQEGNTRSVNILLKYMAEVKFNSSKNFRSIFDQLVEYQGFLTYLERLPLQTSQMLQKNVLKIEESDSDLIVKMCSTQCIYVDDLFYSKNMGEKKNKDGYKSYPVNVFAFRIGWIIRTDEGKDFLNEVLSSENLEYFKLQSMKMIIEFLYRQFKLSLLKYMLPLYIVQVVSLEYMIEMNERVLCLLFQTKFDDSVETVTKLEYKNAVNNSTVTITLWFVIPFITLANLAWLF